MRRFLLERLEDESGISGTGWIAEGIQFTSGACVLAWRPRPGDRLDENTSVAVYPSLKMVDSVHGHGGKTKIRMIDENDPPHDLSCPVISTQIGCNCSMGLDATRLEGGDEG